MGFGLNRATVGLQQKTAGEEMSCSITKLPLRHTTLSTAVNITVSLPDINSVNLCTGQH